MCSEPSSIRNSQLVDSGTLIFLKNLDINNDTIWRRQGMTAAEFHSKNYGKSENT